MTSELETLLLTLPISVRLALLDADPLSPGEYVSYESHFIHTFPPPERVRKDVIEKGAAWLPCNPLSIVKHAAKLLAVRQYGIEHDTGDYTVSVGWEFIQDKCPMTAAVRLLLWSVLRKETQVDTAPITHLE